MMKRKNLGRLGERLAQKHLVDNGYRILDRNFRSQFGEIDLITQKNNCLIFIEVKARWSKKFGSPEEAITPRKIRRIVKTGQYYQLLHPELPRSLRLDAVVIDFSSQDKIDRIEIIENLTG